MIKINLAARPQVITVLYLLVIDNQHNGKASGHLVSLGAYPSFLGAVHILRNPEWGGSSRFITILHRGGSPQFITILHRGGLESLLQYYSFEWKMEGYIPFELSKKSPFHTC